MIRVLHLCSNHKITGPAELALDTARRVEELSHVGPTQEGGNGTSPPVVESSFASSRHPSDPPWLDDLARQRGVRLAQVPRLSLLKHFNPYRSFRDAHILSRYLASEPIDIVHCHLANDHMIAALARRLGCGGRRVPVVRTLYDGGPVAASWRNRLTLKSTCEQLVCFSSEVQRDLETGPLALGGDRVRRLDPPIDTDRFDTDRFDAARLGTREEARAHLGIAPQAFTAGIVARMQRHRRFEVLLDAVKIAAAKIPGFRFVIIGRGTHQEAVAREPVRQMGLSDVVVFAGYLQGEEFVNALRTFDVKLFLVPGSDGTCRAVREAIAAGIPVVAARRGMLPEIVRDGVTGRIVDDTPENLAAALVDLAGDRETLERMSAACRQEAIERFSYRRYVADLLGIYDRVASNQPGSRGSSATNLA